MQSILMLEKINEVNLRISCNEYSELRKIYEYFKVLIPGSQYSPRFKQGIWDGKVSFLDMRTQTMPLGLWKQILEYCQKQNLQYAFKGFDPKELFQNPKFSREFIDLFNENIIEKDLPFCMREDQLQSIHYALQFRKCILLLATGFGKSAVIYELMRILYATEEADRVLIIVPSINLVNQMRSNFVDDYGWKDFDNKGYLLCKDTKDKDKKEISKNEINRPFLVTTWQSIQKKTDKWFQQFDAIIVDEVHGVTNSGKALQSISKKCLNARYKIGLTGTLGDNEADKQTTIGYIGPVAFTVKSKELIDKGVLSKIEIRNLIIRYNEELSLKGLQKEYNTEIDLIESIPERNKIFNTIFDRIEDGQNTLVLAKHLKHIDEIAEYLKSTLDSKYIIKVINGEISGKIREEIRVEMANSKNYILVASFATVGTGLNIPAIDHVIFAASYKAKIKVLQSIGRGLRKAKDKLKMVLWDIVDNFCEVQKTGRLVNKNHVYKHFEQRLEYYKEQEFPFINEQIQL